MSNPGAPLFEISRLERIDKRTLIASFDVALPGIVIRNCRLQSGRRGRFIAGPGVRAGYVDSGWMEFAVFDPELADAIQAAVEARLAAELVDVAV
jgi:hypothetical protein